MDLKPYLIIVTGRPGSGKTTFARALASEIFMPIISRDQIKEGYVQTIGRAHTELPQDTNKIVTEIFFDTFLGLVDKNVSVIAEAAFQHKVWADMLERFMGKARIHFFICKVSDEVAHDRFMKRKLENPMREFFHGDKGVEFNSGSYEEPHLDVPTLCVDTLEKYKPSIKDLGRTIFSCPGNVS